MSAALDAKAFAIYDRSLELSPKEADDYVRHACGDDPALQEAVAQLRQASDDAQRVGFLEEPFPLNAGELTQASEEPEPFKPRRIDRYQLIRELGAGGFGKVYLAEQREPVKRLVALKVLRGNLWDETFQKRFEAERQVLALLSHPNIAQIYDAAATQDGDPYFAMEYVPGLPITQYCDDKRLTLEERLTLFTTVCSAIQHAHQKGIIHRDIKPANILVMDVDGVAQPKVIDFGIAKVLDLDFEAQTLDTHAGGLLGSPAYMSPEQVSQSRVAIDTRSDVYALGVLLYEILLGRTPFSFSNKSLVETLNAVLQTDPVLPSVRALGALPDETLETRHLTSSTALSRQLSGDIDAIVLKALAKNPERRYDSAAAFAADVNRLLNDQPVEATTPSTSYRIRKFAKRHRATVIAVSTITLALLLGLAGTVSGLIRARQAESIASTQAHNAQRTVNLLQDFLAAPDPREQGRDLRVADMLESFEPQLAQLVEQPAVHASLLMTYGMTYRSLGMLDRAQGFAVESVAIRAAHLGPDHRDTLDAKLLVAQINAEMGQHDEANEMLSQLLEDARAGSTPTLFLTEIQDSLARTLYLKGEYEQAAEAYFAAAERRRKLVGESHPDTLVSMTGLSLAYTSLGKHESASRLASEVAAIRRRTQGPSHPDTLSALSSLAFALGEGGDYAEALSLHQQVLAGRKETLGETHPKMLTSQMNVAWILTQLGRHEEAQGLYEETLDVQLETLGEDHPDVYATMSNLASSLNSQALHEEAEQLMIQVVSKRTEILGPKHPTTLTAKNDLMVVYARQGRFIEAESLTREVLEARLEVVGEAHPGTATTMSNLAWVLARRGELEESEALSRKAIATRKALYGADHPQTLSAKRVLATTLSLDNRPEEALDIRREILEFRQQSMGEAHHDTLDAATEVAELLVETGRDQEAVSLLQRTLTLMEETLGAQDPRTSSARQALADLSEGLPM